MLPADEGGPTVNGEYTVIGQSPTVKVIAGNQVIDAMTITVAEQLYGLDFSFTLPRSEWQGAGTAVLALDYTSWSQQLAAHQHVLGMTYAEDTNASGLLIDVWFVTVGTDDGVQTAQVTVPFSALNTPRAFALVDDAYATLLRNAGL